MAQNRKALLGNYNLDDIDTFNVKNLVIEIPLIVYLENRKLYTKNDSDTSVNIRGDMHKFFKLPKEKVLFPGTLAINANCHHGFNLELFPWAPDTTEPYSTFNPRPFLTIQTGIFSRSYEKGKGWLLEERLTFKLERFESYSMFSNDGFYLRFATKLINQIDGTLILNLDTRDYPKGQDFYRQYYEVDILPFEEFN